MLRPTWRALEKLRARLTRRLIASGRQLVADKPVLRAMLRAMWRQLRNRGWGASRSSLHKARQILDAAVPLQVQAASWAGGANRSAPRPQEAILAALMEGRDAEGIVLSVSHDDYAVNFGGIQNVLVDEQRSFEATGWQYLHIAPAAPLPVLAAHAPAAAYWLSLRLNGKPLGVTNFQLLALGLETLREQGARIETIYHHLKGHMPELLAGLAVTAGTQPIVWIHDFFTLCPAFTLMRNDVKFCGAPCATSAACSICAFGVDRRDHAPRLQAFFDAVSPIVLAPSQVTLNFWLRKAGYAHAETSVVPIAHLTMSERSPVGTQATFPMRVAHLGASTMHKGWHVFEELAVRHSNDRRYKFYHLGVDGIPSSKYIHVPVRVTADHRDAMIDAVARNHIDVVICWSLWPETFCYTVHEALAAGAFVVARKDAGNIWPAVESNAPDQGCAVEDEASLFRLFESGEIFSRIAEIHRRHGTLRLSGNTAEFLLRHRAAAVAQAALEVTS